MADSIPFDPSLANAILLLSKVSSKLSAKVDKLSSDLESTNTGIQPKEKTPTETLSEKLTSLFTSSEQKKPEQVVEEEKSVIVSKFGRESMVQLKELITGIPVKPTAEAPKEAESGIMSFVKKLIGPALLLLGGIAALVTGLFSDGPLKGTFTLIGKLGVKEGLKMMAKKLGKFVATKVLKKIPIIGTVIGLFDAYTRFKSDDYVGGTIALLSAFIQLLDFAVPGLGTGLSIGLDVLNAALDLKTGQETDPAKRNQAKLGLLDEWSTKVGKFLADLPIIRNFVMFGEGIGEVLSGNLKEGFFKMAYAVPGFGFFQSLIGLPATEQEALEITQGQSLSDLFNKQLQPLYQSIVGLLPSWMQPLISIDENGVMTFTPGNFVSSIGKSIKYALGIADKRTDDIKEEAAKNNARSANEKAKLALQELQEFNAANPGNSEEIKEQRKKLTAEYMQYRDEAARMAEEVKDFILTPDGKTLKPSENDTILGFQPGGALDNYFNKSYKLTTENNTILKNLTQATNSLLQKQLDVLISSNKLIGEMVTKPQQSNIVSSPTVISNSFSSGVSLRAIQGVTT